MPFIIWGSRGLTSDLEGGTFYCPQCDRDGVTYRLKSSRQWFTLYFIPVFPISGSTKYVECGRCGGTFKEGVLDVRPPTESERLAGRLADELRNGLGVRDAEARLTDMGMATDSAREFVGTLAGEGRWTCPKCGTEYAGTVRKCRACADSRS